MASRNQLVEGLIRTKCEVGGLIYHLFSLGACHLLLKKLRGLRRLFALFKQTLETQGSILECLLVGDYCILLQRISNLSLACLCANQRKTATRSEESAAVRLARVCRANCISKPWVLWIKESEVVTIDFHGAKNLIDSGYGYLDVRTVEEYRKGHVSAEKIFNIPYMFNTPEGRVKNPEFLKEVSSLCNKDDLLVVGCQSGVRSLYATADLLKIGFKNVSNMGGGYLAWVGNRFPVKLEEIPVPEKLEEKPKQEMKEISVPAKV